MEEFKKHLEDEIKEVADYLCSPGNLPIFAFGLFFFSLKILICMPFINLYLLIKDCVLTKKNK